MKILYDVKLLLHLKKDLVQKTLILFFIIINAHFFIRLWYVFYLLKYLHILGSVNELETEEAAELDRWEQEQIRKGVGVTQAST